jgi:hypothetical protein
MLLDVRNLDTIWWDSTDRIEAEDEATELNIISSNAAGDPR